MNLYIMTKGRMGNQETLKHIPDKWLGRTYIVCPYGEHHPHQTIVEPCTMDHSDKLQWLMECIAKQPDGKGVVLDDDLWWDKRVGDKLEVIKDKNELAPMWDSVEKHLDEVPYVGIQPRMMGHKQPLPYRDIGKIITVYAANINLFPDKKVPKIDYDPIMADVHLNLHILAHGLRNRIVTEFVVNWKASQSPGGCDYRTLEMQRDAANRIADMYDGYAKAVTKVPKFSKWLGDSRTDLRIQWKKLYKEAPYGRA